MHIYAFTCLIPKCTCIICQTIRTLEENLKVFNTNYMVLRDFLDDVKQKLQQISAEATEVGLYRTLTVHSVGVLQ